MKDNLPWEFTCKTCGGHQLTVSRVWHLLSGTQSESWQEWGPLDENHHWCFKFKEQIEKIKDDKENREDYRGKFSTYAKANSSSKSEKFEIFEPHKNPGNDRFFVNCTSCDREIIFGWEQPNRGGGIFPVECSDFIPEKIWPEPRYLEFWHQNHWFKRED